MRHNETYSLGSEMKGSKDPKGSRHSLSRQEKTLSLGVCSMAFGDSYKSTGLQQEGFD